MGSAHRFALWNSTLASEGFIREEWALQHDFYEGKRSYIVVKTSLSMSLKLILTNAMLLINQYWDYSFANITTTNNSRERIIPFQPSSS